MRKCLVIVCLGCLFSTGVFSQSAWKFSSTEYVGLLSGQAGGYGQFGTINGASKGSWFLGAGVGLDYYRFRSLPVFLSVTKELMPGKNGFFVSLDAGINCPIYHRPEGYYDYSFTTSKFLPGPYWSAGLGYKIKLPDGRNKDQFLFLSAGYSYKELKEDAKTYPDVSRYDYHNRQWSFKIGFIL